VDVLSDTSTSVLSCASLLRSPSSLHTSFESSASASFDSDVHLLADSQAALSHGHPISTVIGHRSVKPKITVRLMDYC